MAIIKEFQVHNNLFAIDSNIFVFVDLYIKGVLRLSEHWHQDQH